MSLDSTLCAFYEKQECSGRELNQTQSEVEYLPVTVSDPVCKFYGTMYHYEHHLELGVFNYTSGSFVFSDYFSECGMENDFTIRVDDNQDDWNVGPGNTTRWFQCFEESTSGTDLTELTSPSKYSSSIASLTMFSDKFREGFYRFEASTENASAPLTAPPSTAAGVSKHGVRGAVSPDLP